MEKQIETITIGGGCFWCIEAVFQRVQGVTKVESGYCGGHTHSPTYQEICSGLTGHAEVVQVSFDTSQISIDQVLDIFFTVHDPTTLNRQGNDRGTQYRSVIFYHTVAQEQAARAAIQRNQAKWTDPIVTEISPLKVFFIAEDYHQNYFNEHREQPYCIFVVAPKVQKLEEKFGHYVRK